MAIGLLGSLYFIIIVLSNTIGAISGMGGGVIIKPVFDLIGVHQVAEISFYAAVAVFVMSIVSTYRQVKNGVKIKWHFAAWVSIGAILGGFVGTLLLEWLIRRLPNEGYAQMIQIVLTIITLLFAFFYTKYNAPKFELHHLIWYMSCGFVLGSLASLLGIGGGPINVSLLMLLFSLPMKEATVYSICTIFFSQLSKLVSIGFTSGFAIFDLRLLWFIIPAAIIGGLLGAKLSGILTGDKVAFVFQSVILLVLLINIYNGILLIM